MGITAIVMKTWLSLRFQMRGSQFAPDIPVRMQVFEGTTGIDNQGTTLEFTGEVGWIALQCGKAAAHTRYNCCYHIEEGSVASE